MGLEKADPGTQIFNAILVLEQEKQILVGRTLVNEGILFLNHFSANLGKERFKTPELGHFSK